MAGEKLRILGIGAHPDDCEVKMAGVAALWAAAGHTVRFVSATNGETGHQVQAGGQLAQRRIAEAGASARALGVESHVLDIPNEQIEPNLIYRRAIIRVIRLFAPDLILTHRPNDYHPDHRYTSQLVQDSTYVVQVPNTACDVPALRHNPAVAYFCDNFRKPIPFEPAVAVAVDSVMDRKFDALHCHTSQMYEWLPYVDHALEDVPADDADRRQWLFDRRSPADRAVADRFREMLIARYGPQQGRAVQYAEAFEACEYGAKLDQPLLTRLFGGL